MATVRRLVVHSFLFLPDILSMCAPFVTILAVTVSLTSVLLGSREFVWPLQCFVHWRKPGKMNISDGFSFNLLSNLDFFQTAFSIDVGSVADDSVFSPPD